VRLITVGGTAVRWSTRLLRLFATVLVASILGMALAACSGSTPSSSSAGTSSTPKSTVPVPAGWKSYTYEKAEISVPSDWYVGHNTNCPDGQAPGSLLLGFPKVLENCPMIPTGISYVAVTSLPTGDGYRQPPFAPTPVMVNGVPIYEGGGSPGSLVWAAPSLGVQVAGEGPDTRTILHTLRRS